MQSLLDCLQGVQTTGTACIKEWEKLLELAEEQHVLPWVVRLLRARHAEGQEIALPAALEMQLQRAERDAVVAAFIQTAELSELLRGFADEGVEVIPLKGLLLAQRIYGRTDLRISRDLDLLVRKRDFQSAAALLRKLEYAPESLTDDYHQSWRRGTSVVELHFDVENPLAIDFEVEKVWQRAKLASFNGVPLWQLAPTDELLLLCVHGVRHRFEYLGLALDIALAVRALGPAIGPIYPIEGRNQDATMMILLGLAMARRLDPAIDSLLSVNADHQLSAHAERTAVRLWADRLGAQPTPMDWRKQHNFFLELESSSWRKLRRRAMHLRILVVRLIDRDVDYAASLGLRRSWQARVLRPVRLAAGRFQKRSL